MVLPIDREILERRCAIPDLLADLTEKEPEAALHYMRVWGRKEMPITPLFHELSKKLLELESGRD